MTEPTHADIEAMAIRAFDALPAEIRARIANLGFAIEDEPPEGKHWLATYQGIPYTRRAHNRPFEFPHKITIYRGPLLRICGDDPVMLEREMDHIIRHEIAHYFGITDERLIEIDRY